MLGPSVAYTGRIVVRVENSIASAVRNKLSSAPSLVVQGLGGVLSAIQQTNPSSEISALLTHLAHHDALAAQSPVPVAYIQHVFAWEAHSLAGPFPLRYSLLAYWIVDLRGRKAPPSPASIASQLGTHPGISTAYLERNLREPAAPWAVTPDVLTPKQGYVYGLGNESPGSMEFGINARHESVWGQFDGGGVGFVDIERGWRYTHQDFPPRVHVNNPDPVGTLIGSNVAMGQRHGTQTIGVAVGVDHQGAGLGMVGVVPGASLLGVASRVSDDGTDAWRLTAAIVAALDVMTPGDVLLIEVETAGGAEGGFPVEVDDHHFDAVRLASSLGMVVIEPAGNGWTGPGPTEHAHNLDDPIPPRPGNITTPVLNRGDPAFTDSGAVMVASCASTTQPAGGHERQPKSSYGSRIDCYGWGEDVTSPYTDGANPDTDYSGYFGGTSSASAIIAGAALLVQHMAIRSAFPAARLSPVQMRALLGSWDRGTPIYDIGAAQGALPIGTMPDLKSIADEIGFMPDVFIRDDVGDDGSIPSLNVAQSPDIIVRSAALSNPDNDVGQNSNVAEQRVPNDPIVLNQKNYIYVRMRNRGSVQATGVTATVYWAEAGAFIPPTDWNLIGTSAPVDVLAAGAIIGQPYGPLAVAPAIEWIPTQATLPVSHACFIAVLDHPLDPAPPPIRPLAAAPVDWQTFLGFVAAQNNVAWRNFHVLDLVPLGSDFEAEAGFNINGPPNEAAAFDFEVYRAGDREHTWTILLPETLGDRLPEAVTRGYNRDARERIVLPVPARGLRYAGVEVGKKARYRCGVRVVVPRGLNPASSSIEIVQRYRGRSIGRVTFTVDKRSWPR